MSTVLLKMAAGVALAALSVICQQGKKMGSGILIRSSLFRCALCLTVGLFVAGSADAIPVTHSVFTKAHLILAPWKEFETIGTSDTDSGLQQNPANPDQYARAIAAADYGALGGKVVGGVPAYNGELFITGGDTTSEWRDTWLFESSREGAFILRIDWDVDGSVSMSGKGVTSGWSHTIADQVVAGQESTDYGWKPGGFRFTGHVDVPFSFNNEREVYARLTSHAGGSSGFTEDARATVESDLLYTSSVTGFHVLVNGNEVSDYEFITASGNRYDGGTDGTVPEPGSVALLGLGLAGLAASRRRKQ